MIYFKKIIDITKIQSYNAVIEHEDVLNDHLRALFLCKKKNSTGGTYFIKFSKDYEGS